MTFFQSFQAFLFRLRDFYGFLIPADRLRDCLICAENVCDVEEVCYRVQSLVCENQEQIETFQSLFAQTFLGKHPPATSGGEEKKPGQGSGQNKKKEKTPEQRLGEITQETGARKRKIEGLYSEIEKLEKALEKDDTEEHKAARGQMERAKEELETLKSSVSKAREDYDTALSHAIPDMDNPALMQQIQKIDDIVKELEEKGAFSLNGTKEDGDRLKKELNRLKQSLQQPSWQSLVKLCEDASMDFARAVRNANAPSGTFTSALALASAISVLQQVAKKAISKETQNEMKEAKKRNTEARKAADAKQQEYSELRLKVSAVESAKANQRSALMDRRNRVTQEENNLQRLQAEEASIQAKIEQQRRSESEIVQKPRSIYHREEFLGGIHAVQTTEEVEELMQTNLTSMSPAEKAKILSYIRTNARVFRQTLRRKGATAQHRRVDVKRTVRAASKTNGEPVVIKYKASKKSHAKVMILVDLSGSCRSAASMALYFMALMDEAFPGGCRKFAFVKDLVPVDQYFHDRTVDDGIQTVQNNVPTRGVYSNYGQTIHRLKEEYSGTFSKDTTVIVLGDARNNKFSSQAEDLKYIADRTKRVIWLNTDPVYNWNQGDSVIGEYANAGAEVYPVSTAGELLDFLSGLTEATALGQKKK